MLKKLEVLEDKYKELTEKISDPEIINDQKTWQKYMKEHSDLEPIVMKYREYTNVLQSIADSKEIMNLLKRDNIKLEEINDYHKYPIADNDTPQLSSDRLEYSLSNAYFTYNILTYFFIICKFFY